MIEFKLSFEQERLAKAWLKDHKCSVGAYVGAIGGKTRYSFTPTSLGVVVKVRCACKCKIDLTDYKDW